MASKGKGVIGGRLFGKYICLAMISMLLLVGMTSLVYAVECVYMDKDGNLHTGDTNNLPPGSRICYNISNGPQKTDPVDEWKYKPTPYKYDPPGDNGGPVSSSCCEDNLGGNKPNASSTGNAPLVSQAAGRGISGRSFIDNDSKEFFHWSDDYVSTMTSYCSSCGGGYPKNDILGVQLRRYHRSRDAVDYSAFGPSCFSNYDAKLRFYTQDAGNIIAVFDPRIGCPQTFVDGSIDSYFNPNDPKNGIFTSVQSKSAKEIRLLDANGNVVLETASATNAVLTTLDGRKFTFDVINMSVGSGNLTNGLQLHLPFDETEGTTAADASGNGRNGLIDGLTRWTTGRLNGGLGEDLASGSESSWAGTNVNNPLAAGSYTEDGGTWTITGGGGAISYYTDQFYFVNKKLTGDGTIIARLASHNIPTSTSGRAGIMIRQTMENKSKCAVIETGYIDTSFGTRAGTGATMAFSTTYWALAPQWLKLVREGDSFTGYRSTDGVNWVQQGSAVTIPMGDDVYIGMAVCAGDYSGVRTVQAVFDNVSITGNTRDWSTATPGRVVTTGYKGIGGGNPRTVSAWIKTAQSGTIISWGNAATNRQFRVGLKDVNRWLYGALYSEAGTGSKVGSNYVADARWHHIAVVLNDDRIENSLLYVDGVLEYIGATATAQVDTDNIDGNDLVIGDNLSFTDTFKGVMDDIRLYSRALSADEIAELSGQGDIEALTGRLAKIEDRNGYGATINYKAWTQQELAESPSRQFQIDTVTDSNGRTMTFHYGTEQVSGRWAVSSIDMPDGHTTNYIYANGFVSEVQRPDGTSATFSQNYDSGCQCTVLSINDTSAKPTHRKKDVYLSNQISWTGRNGDLLSQSTGLTRLILNKNNEVTYLNSEYGGEYRFIYEGGGRLFDYYGHTTQYATNWSINSNFVVNGSGVVHEPTYEAITYAFGQWEAGTPQTKISKTGRRVDYQYNSASSPTRKTFTDGTTEKWSYNDFQQVTRYEDRLGRVTKYTYDSKGNMLTKEVGIKVVAGQDVNQDEYAVYKWEYYPEGHANQYLLRYEFDAVHDPQTQTGNRKEYIYDSNQRITQVNEPDDAGTGYHAAASYTYDSAGRMLTSADACGRTVTYHYDVAGRVDKITYPDNSTELFIYDSDNNSPTKGLLIKQKDRNGIVAKYEYDSCDRRTKVTASYSTMDADGSNEQVCDSAMQSVTEYTYLCGTNDVQAQTTNGVKTAFAYDYRGRVVSTTVYPRDGQSLTSQSVYANNELTKTVDPYGRATYYVYRQADGAIVRTVRGAVPEDGITDPTIALRDSAPNAKYAITDMDLDAAGQVTKTIDPRAVIHSNEYDSRGRTTAQVSAWGTRDYTQSPAVDTQITDPKIAARSEIVYDADSKVIETRSPRYFDSSDPAFGKARVQMTYTQRNLLASRHVAPDVDDSSDLNKQNATEYFTYYADRRAQTHTDFNGNVTTNYYSPKCARLVFVKDASGAGHITRTDLGGRIILNATVADASAMTDLDAYGNPTATMMGYLLNPPDAAGLAAAATNKYDARNRRIAATIWLNYTAVTDRANPTIAGDGGIPAADGLTSRFYYDDTIADGSGLDDSNAAINICSLKTKLTNASLTFATTGRAASATVTKSPAGELSASISDASGRTVISGMLDSDNSCNAMTWSINKFDATTSITNFGTIVETENDDALAHSNKVHSDGLGRTIESIDALSKKTSYTYAFTYGLSNVAGSVRDPNSTGVDSYTDQQGRTVKTTDTHSDSTQRGYDAESNVVSTTDAKSNSASSSYDVRGRLIEATDRIGAVTKMFYDLNGNLLRIIDGDSNFLHSGDAAASRPATIYTYDSLNRRITQAYPGHNPSSVIGDSDYDKVLFAYDSVGRLIQKTDQKGEYVVFNFNLASQLTSRQYYNVSNVLQDTDTFTYNTTRLVSAEKGRYSNTVSFTYDNAGRMLSENLNVNSTNYTTGYAYDIANRLTQITYPDSSVVTRSYTDRNQFAGTSYQNNSVASRTYDDSGRLTQTTYGNNLVEDRTYRNDNLISTLGIMNVSDFTYSYDANKNRTAEADAILTDHAFTAGYDNKDRLTNFAKNNYPQHDQSWTLSKEGDWNSTAINGTQEDRTHNAVHEIITKGAVSIVTDAKGNITTNWNGKHFAWDFDNRLMSADTDGNDTTDATYGYDALGRRISKTYNSVTTIFARNGWQVIVEYENGTLKRKFVFGDYLDEPLMMLNVNGENEIKYYYHANANYNIAAMTNSAGTVVERYTYTAYGLPLVVLTNNIGNPLLSTGKRYEAELGLQDSNNRLYDPALGRFPTRDPVEDATNIYEYVSGSPVDDLDPDGLKVWLVKETGFTSWAYGIGVYHFALVVEDCKGNKETYEISRNPNMPGGGGSAGQSSWLGASTGGSSYGPAGFSIGATGGSGAGKSSASNNNGNGVSGPTHTPNKDTTEGVNGREAVLVADGYCYDDKFRKAAETTSFGDYNIYTNNCGHWARKVIENAGGQWPFKDDINYGANPGNPGFPGPLPVPTPELRVQLPTDDRYQDVKRDFARRIQELQKANNANSKTKP